MGTSFNDINVTEHDGYITLNVNGAEFNLEIVPENQKEEE